MAVGYYGYMLRKKQEALAAATTWATAEFQGRYDRDEAYRKMLVDQIMGLDERIEAYTELVSKLGIVDPEKDPATFRDQITTTTGAGGTGKSALDAFQELRLGTEVLEEMNLERLKITEGVFAPHETFAKGVQSQFTEKVSGNFSRLNESKNRNSFAKAASKSFSEYAPLLNNPDLSVQEKQVIFASARNAIVSEINKKQGTKKVDGKPVPYFSKAEINSIVSGAYSNSSSPVIPDSNIIIDAGLDPVIAKYANTRDIASADAVEMQRGVVNLQREQLGLYPLQAGTFKRETQKLSKEARGIIDKRQTPEFLAVAEALYDDGVIDKDEERAWKASHPDAPSLKELRMTFLDDYRLSQLESVGRANLGLADATGRRAQLMSEEAELRRRPIPTYAEVQQKTGDVYKQMPESRYPLPKLSGSGEAMMRGIGNIVMAEREGKTQPQVDPDIQRMGKMIHGNFSPEMYPEEAAKIAAQMGEDITQDSRTLSDQILLEALKLSVRDTPNSP